MTWRDDGVAVKIELATNGTPTGDQATFTWLDISCDLRALLIRHGRQRFTERYEVGVMSLTVRNDDGKYAYSDPQPIGLRPGRPIRVAATYNAITYPMGYGIIDSISDEYELDGFNVVTINTLDPTSLLAAYNPIDDGTVYGANDTPAGRVKRLCDWVKYPYMKWAKSGTPNLQSFATTRDFRDEAGIAADSSDGAMYAERDGWIWYRDDHFPQDQEYGQTVTANWYAIPESDISRYREPAYAFPWVGGYVSSTNPPVTAMPGTSVTSLVNPLSTMANGTFTIIECGTQFRWRIVNGDFVFESNNAGVWVGGIVATAAELALTAGEDKWIATTANTSGATFVAQAWQSDDGDMWVPMSTQKDFGTAFVPATTGTQIRIGDFFDGYIYEVTAWQTATLDVTATEVIRFDADDHTTGTVWVDQRGRQWTIPNQYLIIHPEFATDPDAPDVCPANLNTDWSVDAVINRVMLANANRSAQTFDDAESQSAENGYGVRSYQRLDLIAVDDTNLPRKANRILTARKDARPRVSALAANMAVNGNAWAWALAVFLGWLIRVEYHHPYNGWGWQLLTYVQSIEHSIGPSDWGIALAVDDAGAYTDLVANDVWDVGRWDFAKWV